MEVIKTSTNFGGLGWNASTSKEKGRYGWRGHLSPVEIIRELSPSTRPKTSSSGLALLMALPHQAGRDSLTLRVVP